jgi:hypothetical protein
MRRLLLFSAMIVGAGCVGLTPAMATALGMPALSPNVSTPLEKVGY